MPQRDFYDGMTDGYSIKRGVMKAAPSVQRKRLKRAEDYYAGYAPSVKRFKKDDVVDNVMKRVNAKKGVKYNG